MTTNPSSEVAGKTSRRCHVCKARLKMHEGNLCSCRILLCMNHRYKDAHSCALANVATCLQKVEAKKIDKI